MTLYFVDPQGTYIGGFDGVQPPANSVEVPTAPHDARQKWSNNAWTEVPMDIAPVSPRQIRQALTHFNFRSQVEAAVTAGDQNLKDWWEFASSFERLHPEVLAMASAMGFTADQLDAVWTYAAGI